MGLLLSTLSFLEKKGRRWRKICDTGDAFLRLGLGLDRLDDEQTQLIVVHFDGQYR